MPVLMPAAAGILYVFRSSLILSHTLSAVAANLQKQTRLFRMLICLI